MTSNHPIKLRRTTVFRLSMIYAAGFCLLTIIALVVAYQHVLGEANKQIDAGLRAEAASLAADWQSADRGELVRKLRARSTPSSLHASNKEDSGPRFYLLIDAHGQYLAGSIPQWHKALQQQGDANLATLTLHTPSAIRYLVENHSFLSLRSHQTLLPGGARLLVAQSLNELAELQRELLILIALVTILMLSAGALGGWWIGNRVVRSMEKVIQTASDIMAGDLSKRLPVADLSDEFSLLAERLNLMLARIERLMTDLHDVTENVAHDLRTPLTRLRTHAEMALQQDDVTLTRDALLSVITQTEALVRLLNTLLSIAQIEADNKLEWRPLDLRQVCQDVADLYEPVAELKGLALTLDLPSTQINIVGNPQLLAQAISNLLDNAIKYTPELGHIHLQLSAKEQITLTLTDTGQGIPESSRQRALQRFVRLDNSRSKPGNGLGLALVASIVRQHNGTLQLDTAYPDQKPSGLKVCITLPLITLALD